MTRLLTPEEIENIIDFVQPRDDIPEDTAMSIVNSIKNNFRKQLEVQQIYPEIIPELKNEIKRQYRTSQIQPGETVGVICAQSIGEKQTQCTLNSIDWQEQILFTKNGTGNVSPIGKFIDDILANNTQAITHIPENRTEYLQLPDGYMIPSCDENGYCNWYKIEAITKHLPVGKLVKVLTESGRTVMATQSKSFLVWNGSKFEATLGSNIKVGDILPTTFNLNRPNIRHLEILKARKQWKEQNGTHFTKSYNRPDTCFGKRKDYFLSYQPGIVYIHTSATFKIPLDNDFGFFVGLYLSEGLVTKTYVCISNNEECIRKRITDWCDRYGITYHLVTSEGKNVRKGISNELKIHCTLLARLMLNICDTGSANKKVPVFAYTAPDDFIKGLIDGYYSGDGSICMDGRITTSSASEDLITGISFLLSYFGVFGCMSSSGIKKAYILVISNGFAQQFARSFTLTEQNKQERLKNITLTKKYREKYLFDRDVYFDPVVSVEYVEGTSEYVYDLTVEHTRNFQLWNGLTVSDTFHTAGMSEKTMTAGVPRIQELLNATKNPRIVNYRIPFLKGNKSIQDIRKTVGHSIVGLTMKDISDSISVEMNKQDEAWYDAYRILFSNNFDNYQHCITFHLKMQKLFEFKLSLEQVAKYIENEYNDLQCVFSPPREGQLDVFVDTSNIILPENRLLFIDQENAIPIYLEECVQNTLEKMYICGIPAITEIFYTKDDKGEWLAETNGFNSKIISKQYSSFKKLLAHPNVDYTRAISNNVWDIYEILDIEAARQFLINEFSNFMEGINTCHTMLLVDRMTYGGTIASISRYTLKADECGALGKASFEETMDHFLNAAAQGQHESTKGVSASIICGKRANIGTGMISVGIDIPRLPVAPLWNLPKKDDKKKITNIVLNDITLI